MNCTRSPKQVDVVLSGPLDGLALRDRLENGFPGGLTLGNRLQNRLRAVSTLETAIETVSGAVLP